MSTRRVATSLDSRVAQIEDFVRSLQSTTAIKPTDTRYLYSAKGDILIAVGPSDPQPLAAGAAGEVLTVGPGSMPRWEDPDRVRQSIVADKGWIILGTGAGTVTAIAPGADGTVLTADSAALAGAVWL